jgi:hypothetical protein
MVCGAYLKTARQGPLGWCRSSWCGGDNDKVDPIILAKYTLLIRGEK